MPFSAPAGCFSHLYSEAEVPSLLDHARRLRDPILSSTYSTLLALLAATGMRVGEALALDDGDLDLERSIVTVRRAKFGKSRLVPLHPTTSLALQQYVRRRNRLYPRRRTPSFFISSTGRRVWHQNFHHVFLRLVAQAGIRGPAGRRARLHDLRHTFAVKTVADWYRAGLDVERRLPWLSTYLGHVSPTSTYWYLSTTPELLDAAGARLEQFWKARPLPPPLLEAFFTERLQQQRRASSNTIAAYRDAFRLLLHFAEKHLGRPPSALLLTDIDADFVAHFLLQLEQARQNGARSRNARLSAIRSFFRFIAAREPEHSALIQRVLAMPQQRFDRDLVAFLTTPEIEALLAAPDQATRLGRRDYTLLVIAVQTGLRVSELTGLRVEDLTFGVGAHVRCRGKGRKERCTPITATTVKVVRAWLAETGATGPALLLSTRHGSQLSRDAVERLVARRGAGCTNVSDARPKTRHAPYPPTLDRRGPSPVGCRPRRHRPLVLSPRASRPRRSISTPTSL